MAETEPASPSPPPESGTVTPMAADSLTPRLSEKLRAQRTLVAREILSTEQTYVDMLQTLVDVYFEPTKKLFDDKTHAQLFSNILTVRDVNLRFLADLEKRIADWNEDESTIGDIFLTYVPFFRMYTQYVNNYERTGSLVSELKSHKRFGKFRAFEQQARKHPRCHGQRLAQFLIIPIQRIPRYKLLLRELRKNTHSSHPDDKLLSKALVEVDKVAQQINEAVRASENRKTVLEIQNKFQDAQFLTPTRLFIVSGSLSKTSPQERAQSFKFFLFNDLLVWARHRKNDQKYRIEFSLPIDELFFVETVPESLMPNSIKIIYDQQSFLLSASSIVDRDAWLVNFQKCIRQRARTIKGQNAMLHGSGIRRASFVLAPLFKPKNQADKCHLCAKSFGLLRQRHNCRCCGEVVCADCSPHRLPVASLGTKVRVCSPCQEQVSRDERLQEQQLAQIESFLKSRSLYKRRQDTSQDLLSPTRSRDRSGSDLSIPEALSDDHKITVEASEHSEDSCGNPTNAPQDRSASPSLVESIQRFNVLTSSGRASPDDAESGLSLRLPKARTGTASSSVSPSPSDQSAPGLEYPPVSARMQHSRTLRPEEIKAILLSGFEPEDDAADLSLLLSDVDLEQQCRRLGIPLPMDREVSVSDNIVRPFARPLSFANPKRASLDSDDASHLEPPREPPPPPPS